MRLADSSVPLRAPIFLLGFWAVLGPVQCPQGRPSWRYISSEVVIPRKQLHHGKGAQVPGWLSYSLTFGGRRHVIHMRRKKLFWPRHLVMMTQDDQGALQMDSPFVPLDCYYLGYLEEVPLSMVTVDTCYGGLEGIMKLDDLAYEIRPLRDSPGFEHVVSQIVADANATGPMYELGFREPRHPPISQANSSAVSRVSSKIYAAHRPHIRACLMSSKAVYDLYKNMTACTRFLVHLGSLIGSMYQHLDFRYYISLLFIFNVADPASVNVYQLSKSPFNRYYVDNIFKVFLPHTSLIVIKDGPKDSEFDPDLYTMTGNRNLIPLGHLGRHYLLLSIVASHKIGRSFGLYFDESTCVCQRRTTCIMFKHPNLTDAFSNCSYVHIQHIFPNLLRILFDPVYQHYNRTLTYEWCGNSVVDVQEQCDCGSFKQCYSNACCQTDCTFEPGSDCNTGRCCTNCTYSPRGTLCRPVLNICDLPEYCLGDTATCPENFYLQDGTPCSEDGYCYHGNCTDRNMHCKEIFGKGAQMGPDACYKINRKGNRFGHCVIGTGFYQAACGISDIQCGRLQCMNVTHLPRLQEHVGFHQTLIEESLCFGVGAHRGTETLDVGAVRDGTPCGGEKICLERRCNGTMANLSYDCHPTKCNLRGICNNKGNCHCHVGWDPPRCIHKGAGGSVDSGPPPRRMRTVVQSNTTLLYLRVIFARLYVLIATFLFGVATNVKTVQTTTVMEVTVDQ